MIGYATASPTCTASHNCAALCNSKSMVTTLRLHVSELACQHSRQAAAASKRAMPLAQSDVSHAPGWWRRCCTRCRHSTRRRTQMPPRAPCATDAWDRWGQSRRQKSRSCCQGAQRGCQCAHRPIVVRSAPTDDRRRCRPREAMTARPGRPPLARLLDRAAPSAQPLGLGPATTCRVSGTRVLRTQRAASAARRGLCRGPCLAGTAGLAQMRVRTALVQGRGRQGCRRRQRQQSRQPSMAHGWARPRHCRLTLLRYWACCCTTPEVIN